MGPNCFLLLPFTLSVVISEFITPEFTTGLSKISEAENAELNEICGTAPTQNKMNDGTIARKGQFPWAVALEGSDNERFCSGTIISQKHVITAAHCAVRLEYLEPKTCKSNPVSIPSDEVNSKMMGGYVAYGGTCNMRNRKDLNLTGSPCKEDDLQRVLISSVAWERRYRDRPDAQKCTNFDVAIVEVARAFEWSDFVRPACVPLSNNWGLTNNLTAKFYGFGFVRIGEIEESEQFFPDLRFGEGEIEYINDKFIVKVNPAAASVDHSKEGTSSLAQVESGDSGGGITVFPLCNARTFIVAVNTDALPVNSKLERRTKGGQIVPHQQEICELTGICPADLCEGK